MTGETGRSRRSVLAGAAWTAPVIVGVSAAPAFAASPCAGFAFPAMPSSGVGGNGWTRPSNAAVGAGANNFSGGPSYALDADPTTLLETSLVIQVSVTLTAGKSYTFSWSYTKFGSNPRRLYADFIIDGTIVDVAKRMDSDVGPNNTQITRTQVYVPGTTKSYAVGFRMTFPLGTSNVGDDMVIASPTVTCA